MGLKASFDGNLIAEVTSGDIIELQTASFQAAEGDLTVNYTHAAAPIFTQVEGGCLMELLDFSETFTPELAPPEGFTAHTITARGAPTVECIFVTHHDYPDHAEHTITATAGAILVDFMHVDDVPP